MYDDWEKHLIPLAGSQPGLTLLEIGIFETQSSIWFLEYILTANDDRYIRVAPSAAVEDAAWTVRQTLSPYGEKVVIVKGSLTDALENHLRPDLLFPDNIDIVYLNGVRNSKVVHLDSESIWPLVSIGGIIIWNAYRMRARRRRNEVAKAVDPFLATRKERYEELWVNRQMAIRKTAA